MNLYGKAPFNIVLLHGGPGAAGEMAPVAKSLSENFGIAEPIQSKISINAQVKELKSQIDELPEKPVKLIGWSWGAWLAYIFASKFPDYVSKMILVSSGPFEEQYAKNIMKTRLNRLTADEQVELISLFETFDKSDINLKIIINLIEKADAYEPIKHDDVEIDFNYKIYKKIWNEADDLRQSGKLLSYGEKINCPVIAIHGDYDPHPYEGVVIPLKRTLKDFSYELIERCGHHPWFEEYAKDKFYEILKKELD